MEIKINPSTPAEQLSDYSSIMLEAIEELKWLRARRITQGKNTCGVVYSTDDPTEVAGLEAAMRGVFDYYESPEREEVVPTFKQTTTPNKWWYGIDLWWPKSSFTSV